MLSVLDKSSNACTVVSGLRSPTWSSDNLENSIGSESSTQSRTDCDFLEFTVSVVVVLGRHKLSSATFVNSNYAIVFSGEVVKSNDSLNSQ